MKKLPVAGALIVLPAAAGYFGLRAATAPARCGDGFVPMAAGRCCAPGQRVEGGLCLGEPTSCPPPLELAEGRCVAPSLRVAIPAGQVTVGPSDWEAQGTVQPRTIRVDAFAIDAFEITEARWVACVLAGRCAENAIDARDAARAATLTLDEARALCAFEGGDLPTDDQWTYVALGPTGHRYPWGDTGAVCHRAAFGLAAGPCGKDAVGPDTVSAHGAGRSPEGVYDLAGNVAEWTIGPSGPSLRGGSWASSLATALRGWNREAAAAVPPRQAGARCAFSSRLRARISLVAFSDFAKRNPLRMTAAVLSVGTEITRGEIVNTNASWLSAELTEIGFEVSEVQVVDDHRERVVEALHRLARSHRVIVCTGGLGPTTDDLTAECVARALGVPLVRHEPSLEAIRRRLEKAGRELGPSNAKQADLPQGAEPLANAVGTAPGFAVHLGQTLAFFLPGVPREMQKLWEDHLLPRLRPLAPNVAHQIRLRTFGLPESVVGDKLAGLEEQNPGLTIGYRATFPEIEVKVHVRAGSADEARTKAFALADEVRARLGDEVVYGEGADTFPEAVARAVRARGWRLAIAESCTGGLASALLTATPASDYFVGGAVVYANPAKTRLLGVDEDVLRAHGAVSAEVAEAMAEGARRGCDVDVALSITGIAGPTGGTPEKPVGLVHWAVAHPGGTITKHRVFSGDRPQIQKLAAFHALALVREVARTDDRLSTRIKL